MNTAFCCQLSAQSVCRKGKFMPNTHRGKWKQRLVGPPRNCCTLLTYRRTQCCPAGASFQAPATHTEPSARLSDISTSLRSQLRSPPFILAYNCFVLFCLRKRACWEKLLWLSTRHAPPAGGSGAASGEWCCHSNLSKGFERRGGRWWLWLGRWVLGELNEIVINYKWFNKSVCNCLTSISPRDDNGGPLMKNRIWNGQQSGSYCNNWGIKKHLQMKRLNLFVCQ